MQKKNEVSLYLENISLLILGILYLSYPLVFAPLTTDKFAIPKQALLGTTVLITLLLFAAKMIADGKVKIRRTPFDLPIIFLTLALFLSSLFSLNRTDALITFVPFLFAVFAYFLVVNLSKISSSIIFLLSSLILGASLTAIIAILSYFKLYLFPYVFDFTKSQSFSPLGSLLDQTLYLGFVLPVILYPTIKIVRNLKNITVKTALIPLSFVIILAGFVITIYQLLKLPVSAGGLLLLPFETGFQTAFAAISQDSGRILPGFLFGSGFGTYVTDFTRFKQVAFNLNPNLWSVTFIRSSSFFLELLAVSGVVGVSAFVFLLIRLVKIAREKLVIKENIVSLSILLAVITSLILPFSGNIQTAFFMLLAIFAAWQGTSDINRFYDVELHFVQLRKRLFGEERFFVKSLPVLMFLLFLLTTAGLGFFSARFLSADVIFQKSLNSASANKLIEIYNNQTSAIGIFPHRDGFYRVYSQTNITLANSLAAQIPANSSPSAQTQQTISTLIQQSITNARAATDIAPQTAVNWQNLSSIYRSLIGFGQNAENFALVYAQQGLALDPNNPQQYLNLGGIYYQLGKYEDAQRQFQVAVNLKPDFANAYYNLGHALEQKGDLQVALEQYQKVKNLLANDKPNLKRIEEEIKALQQKIGSLSETTNEQTPKTTTETSTTNQPPLKVSSPSSQLPPQSPPVNLSP